MQISAARKSLLLGIMPGKRSQVPLEAASHSDIDAEIQVMVCQKFLDAG